MSLEGKSLVARLSIDSIVLSLFLLVCVCTCVCVCVCVCVARERLVEITVLTTAMSGCLIVNTVTLLMVVVVLCRLKKRDGHAPKDGSDRQESAEGEGERRGSKDID